jgi:hypothetical protein
MLRGAFPFLPNLKTRLLISRSNAPLLHDLRVFPYLGGEIGHSQTVRSIDDVQRSMKLVSELRQGRKHSETHEHFRLVNHRTLSAT